MPPFGNTDLSETDGRHRSRLNRVETALTYAELLTRAAGIRAGDREAAQGYLICLAQCLETDTLSTDERRRIYKLRKKWAARANGVDARWNALGSRPGRRKSVRRGQYSDEEEDPLVASILRKYGTPIVEDP